MQYYDWGWFSVAFTLVLVAFILINIRRARKRDVFLRRIAGLNAIDDAIGRATEMGRPVVMVPGLGSEGQIGIMAQSLVIFSYIARTIAKFGTPLRLCVAYAPAYTLAQEIIRDAYQAEGQLEKYDPDSVQFLTDQQFAFAAAVSGMIHRDQTAACFFLGAFYAESLIFAETANRIGAIQVAGSTQNTQTPFFIAACDYVLIADEFYAASAYLGREPVLVGSLTGQDWSKILIGATIAVLCLTASIQTQTTTDRVRTPDGRWVSAPSHKVSAKETIAYAIFHPAEKIRGESVTMTKPSLEAYLADRKSELGAIADAVVVEEGTVGDREGKWYQWEVAEGGMTRFIEDFVVETPSGVEVIRTYRSRLKRPPAAPTSGGGEA